MAYNTIPRTGLMGGEECPQYAKHAKVIENKENIPKTYCDIKNCPYNNLKKNKIETIDLEFNECLTKGLISKL